MKPVKSPLKTNKHTGRFSTAEEAAQAKNAALVASLKKINLKVLTEKSVMEQAKH